MSNLVITRGVDNVFSIVVAVDGSVVDLTGAALSFLAKQNAGDPDDQALINLSIGDGIEVPSPMTGSATLTITAAQTNALSIEQSFLYYAFSMDQGSGPELLDSGTISVVADVSPRYYIQVQDLRDQGLPASDFSDNVILSSIKVWQQFLERATRQWFYPLPLELLLDGTDSDAIHFGVPCISIAELRLNKSVSALDPTLYEVYNNLSGYPADRQNPRVKLIDSREGWRDIYTAPLREGRLLFRKGRKNQYIRGVFGYVEADGSTPELIKRALTKLVVEKLTNPLYVAAGTTAPTPSIAQRGIVTAEWTDVHKLSYAQAGGTVKAKAPGLNGITDDQEILTIIKLYKAPLGVATPANPSYV